MPLLSNKPNNGRLAAHFPDITQAEFFRRELKFTVGLDQEEIEIQLSLISPWEEFVAYL